MTYEVDSVTDFLPEVGKVPRFVTSSAQKTAFGRYGPGISGLLFINTVRHECCSVLIGTGRRAPAKLRVIYGKVRVMEL